MAALGTAAAGCRTPCEDFVDAVEECQGAPDDYYNQAYCDENEERGCDDRRYYNCMEDHMTCANGQASSTPIICSLESSFGCPEPSS